MKLILATLFVALYRHDRFQAEKIRNFNLFSFANLLELLRNEKIVARFWRSDYSLVAGHFPHKQSARGYLAQSRLIQHRLHVGNRMDKHPKRIPSDLLHDIHNCDD